MTITRTLTTLGGLLAATLALAQPPAPAAPPAPPAAEASPTPQAAPARPARAPRQPVAAAPAAVWDAPPAIDAPPAPRQPVATFAPAPPATPAAVWDAPDAIDAPPAPPVPPAPPQVWNAPPAQDASSAPRPFPAAVWDALDAIDAPAAPPVPPAPPQVWNAPPAPRRPVAALAPAPPAAPAAVWDALDAIDAPPELPVPPAPPQAWDAPAAQDAPPAPQAVPAPRPFPAPAAPVWDGPVPAPGFTPEAMDRFEEDARRASDRLAQRAAERAAEVERRMPDIEERMAAARGRIDAIGAQMPFLAQQIGGMGQIGKPARRYGSEDNLYEAGKRALDNHRWDEALEDFNQLASSAGSRADSAWYWKAYALNKLGRRDEAVAALAELRKSFPNSLWLNDAKVLDLEVQQAAGKPVSPDQQADEDLKLIAINSIMQSDPDRAIPLIENLLKTSTSPKLKERAVFVLAQSGSPRAHQVLEQIARGGGNPDLQVKAIEYMRQWRRQNELNPNLLPEIYASTSDPGVKRAILNTYGSYREYDHLLQAAKSEKNHDLLVQAYQQLSNNDGQPELWQLYQTETTPDGKVQILDCMYRNGSVEKLGEVVRSEKDLKVRSAAIRVLAQQKSNTADTLVSVYGSEQDEKIKQTIVDSLFSQRNAKAMVELARAEKDPKMKLKIVDRLGNMKSKEASDYLLEILSK